VHVGIFLHPLDVWSIDIGITYLKQIQQDQEQHIRNKKMFQIFQEGKLAHVDLKSVSVRSKAYQKNLLTAITIFNIDDLYEYNGLYDKIKQEKRIWLDVKIEI